MRILFALLLSAVAAMAQTPSPAPVTEYYKPGISFDVFGSARTEDLNDYRTGVGLGANLWFANNLGVGVEALTENSAGDFVDYANVNGLWRITSGRAALNLLGGFGYDIERSEGFIAVGGGPEYALGRNISVFGDARGVKGLEGSDITGLFRAGLKFSF